MTYLLADSIYPFFFPFHSSSFIILLRLPNSPLLPLYNPALAPLKETFYSDVYLEMLVPCQSSMVLKRPLKEGERMKPSCLEEISEGSDSGGTQQSGFN